MVESDQRGAGGRHDRGGGLQTERDRVHDDHHDDGALKPRVLREHGESAAKRPGGVFGHGMQTPVDSKFVVTIALSMASMAPDADRLAYRGHCPSRGAPASGNVVSIV